MKGLILHQSTYWYMFVQIYPVLFLLVYLNCSHSGKVLHLGNSLVYPVDPQCWSLRKEKGVWGQRFKGAEI